MITPKDILVVTTSTIEGRKIKNHLKPVTAHIVAGTNLFSDIFASFSDVFGGRSASYQKQLTSLYNEAIYKIKLAAHELGANCVVGLSIDMDEISGKNKSMFMLTAIGTAVIIEENTNLPIPVSTDETFENVSYERVNILYKKKELLKKAEDGLLGINDENWQFFTANLVDEVFPFLLEKYQAILQGQLLQITVKEFYEKLVTYVDAFPEEKKIKMLYESLFTENNDLIIALLGNMINELQLLELKYVTDLLHNPDFKKQKIALQLLTYNKPFYNKDDVEALDKIKNYIQHNFKERGTITTKKQMLSSKEKEVWVCECGKTNDIPTPNNKSGQYCDMCIKDIFGFKSNEINPAKAISNLNTKIELISELIN